MKRSTATGKNRKFVVIIFILGNQIKFFAFVVSYLEKH